MGKGLMNPKDSVVLFYPHIGKNAIKYVTQVLNSRWIGQGPLVDEFEQKFSDKFLGGHPCVAVNSGTSALHLAYILAGIKADDEVITPVFTCTATNTPLLWMGAKITFCDVNPFTMNVSVKHLKTLVNNKTKAIVCVHYGGLPCDMDEITHIADYYGIPVIEDAAHSLGAKYKGKNIGTISDYTMFSFQGVKHITCADGGMLVCPEDQIEKAKRLRWFGIDRVKKQEGIWYNNITEVGYKYQMADVAAAIGLAGLEEFDKVLAYRQCLLKIYEDNIGHLIIGSGQIDRTHAAWLCTIRVHVDRDKLQTKLRENNIETNQTHSRNDRYDVFGGRKGGLMNMDAMEDRYQILPLHTHMKPEDVYKICKLIKGGW